MAGSISQAHMELIVDRIHEGRCVPFLGAAANVSNPARNYEGLMLGASVASELVQKIKIKFKGRDPSNLARIALQCESETDRYRLVQSLMEILPDDLRQPSPLLRSLAVLPFKMIVTTNYDRLLEHALQDQNRDFAPLVQPLVGFENTPETRARFDKLEGYEGLILYKIHGSFQHTAAAIGDLKKEEIPQVIITEDDYIEFLTLVGKDQERIGIPKLITKRLVPNTLLFLGYSLEDWDFRTVYKGLIEPLPKHDKRKSFAIQRKPSKFWVEFWKQKGVEIYDMDLYTFAEQLEQSYRNKYS